MREDRRFVLVFLFIAVIALVSMIMIGKAWPQIVVATCLNADARERARGIILEGIDAALKQHTVTVFESWLKDPNEQPARAIRGLRSGISAYARARAAALNWHFPLCKPE